MDVRNSKSENMTRPGEKSLEKVIENVTITPVEILSKNLVIQKKT